MKNVHDKHDRQVFLIRMREKIDQGKQLTPSELDYILDLAELSEGLRDDSLAAHDALTNAGVGDVAARLDIRVARLVKMTCADETAQLRTALAATSAALEEALHWRPIAEDSARVCRTLREACK